ncbi:hypothetical protein CDAR_395871 [Caerostris darwini]|uniref:Uncharacterized protein n=1 Tax=Caerostris darwini TaxID=1538125 RepID=A0AAV4QKT0_9ARAC|nr:hypothetical protein CDAR_395871 [Caerostris darwini]
MDVCSGSESTLNPPPEALPKSNFSVPNHSNSGTEHWHCSSQSQNLFPSTSQIRAPALHTLSRELFPQGVNSRFAASFHCCTPPAPPEIREAYLPVSKFPARKRAAAKDLPSCQPAMLGNWKRLATSLLPVTLLIPEHHLKCCPSQTFPPLTTPNSGTRHWHWHCYSQSQNLFPSTSQIRAPALHTLSRELFPQGVNSRFAPASFAAPHPHPTSRYPRAYLPVSKFPPRKRAARKRFTKLPASDARKLEKTCYQPFGLLKSIHRYLEYLSIIFLGKV